MSANKEVKPKVIKPTNDVQCFIDHGNRIHKNKYDYSLVTTIKNRDTVVPIICPIHGLFTPTVERHLAGKDCRKCGWLKTRVTLEEAIERAKAVHGDKYDYTTAVLTHGKETTITIRCRVHGDFTQRLDGHLRYGCEQCARDELKLTNEDFIERSKLVHGETYDYSLVKITGINDKVDILCAKHGKFEQRPYDHYRGNGCPKCKTSHGERLIKLFLEKNHIAYETEHKVANTPYRYDYYIPEINLLIEYDGQLHFNRNNSYGGVQALKHVQRLDKIKDALAHEQGYFLMRIHYKDYRNLQELIIKHINDMYPYRYNNKFYKTKEQLLEENSIEPNAIDSILNDSKTYLVLQEVKFAVKLKHNIKKYKHKSQLK